MSMKIVPQSIPEVLLIEPDVFGDQRGFFLESWSRRRYAEEGILHSFVQDNISRSKQGILRGLHLQSPKAQGKLVQVLEGEVFDVAVDVRRKSPTFGRFVGVVLSQSNHRQLWIPPGFAHGFLVRSEVALFQYKCTEYYSPADEITIRWDDPEIAIDWPQRRPILSPKDQRGCLLRDIPRERLCLYRPPVDSRPAFH